MSFREISACVMGLMMAASGYYYLSLFIEASRDAAWATPPPAAFVPYAIFVAFWSIVAQILLAIVAPKDADAPADERERPLLDKAGHWSGLVLGAGVVASLFHYIYSGNGDLMFHMIVGSLILCQFAEYALQVLLLRRSA
ncbi:MAG: hypothetical protein ABW184_07505 [Sphingobium sp.]